MPDNKNKEEEENIEFQWNKKKYTAKNKSSEQKISDENKENPITVKDLKKNIFWTSASINEGQVKPIKWHWLRIIGVFALFLLIIGGLVWFIASRRNKHQMTKEEDLL